MAKPGEIVVVNFPGIQGLKRRPALVVSTDIYHQNRPDAIFGLITSQLSFASSPTDYVLHDWQSAGLHSRSAFRAFLVTLPRTAITANVGQLSDRDWKAILICLQNAIAK